MYGFGFAPFLVLLWSANCGIQFILAIDGKCPWYVFILSIIVDLAYSTLVTIGVCKKLRNAASVELNPTDKPSKLNKPIL